MSFLAEPTPPSEPGSQATGPGVALPIAAIAVASWAIVPPYLGPELGTASRLEVADHVVPGVIVVVIALTSIAMRGRDIVFYAAALAVTLCGLWITVTHLPLIADAARDRVDWGSALHHSLPGPAVLAVGIAWALRARTSGGDAAGPRPG